MEDEKVGQYGIYDVYGDVYGVVAEDVEAADGVIGRKAEERDPSIPPHQEVEEVPEGSNLFVIDYLVEVVELEFGIKRVGIDEEYRCYNRKYRDPSRPSAFKESFHP